MDFSGAFANGRERAVHITACSLLLVVDGDGDGGGNLFHDAELSLQWHNGKESMPCRIRG
jgi:hypothetical protein